MRTPIRLPSEAPAAVLGPLAWRALVTEYVLTTVHHVYGGIAFGTPGRLHMALGFTLLFGLTLALRRGHSRAAGQALRAVVIVFWIGLLGGYEGGYNHLYASLRFAAGNPLPGYPADLLFQATGILTFAAAAVTAFALLRPSRGGGGGFRLAAGQQVEPSTLETIDGRQIDIVQPDGLTHIQFRRFAGCPLCDLHLRSFARRLPEIEAAGISEIVLFHSPAGPLRRHAGDLPFAVVADPDRRHYRRFGVETGARALLDPRAWGPILFALGRSLAKTVAGRAPMPPTNPREGRLGLPADFLIDGTGRILACRYGAHAYDQWSVDELLALAKPRATGPLQAAAAK